MAKAADRMSAENGKTYKIAVIAGDGIGTEVVPEGVRVLEGAGRRFSFQFAWHNFDWSCATYLSTGRMMPADGLDQLRAFDAIFLGAVGHPRVPDHISLWGLLIPIRRAFRQYVNLRPVRLFPGVESPLKGYPPRTEFYRQHLAELARAMSDGARVRAYHAWSLLDNFEWDNGYTQRFGLTYVDFATQQRTIKDSGYWYGRVAAANRLNV